MLYAVSEIIFFLLIATVVGGVAGWWLARSGKISVSAAMDRSGAHAASSRELDAANSEIERLTAKLSIATDAIRELEAEGGAAPELPAEPPQSLPEVPAAPVALTAIATDDVAEPESAEDDEPEDDAEVVSTGAADTGAAGDDIDADEFIVESVKAKGGKRLSTRVAEASVFSRAERSAPKIEFKSDGDE